MAPYTLQIAHLEHPVASLITAHVWDLHDMGDEHPAHGHDFLEIVIVLDGEVTHRSQTGDSRLTRGDGVLLRPGTWHSYHDATPTFEAINLCFAPSLLRHDLAWLWQQPATRHLLLVQPLSGAAQGLFAFHLDEPALAEWVAALHFLIAACASRDPHRHVERLGGLVLCLGRLTALLDARGPVVGADRTWHQAVRQSVVQLESDLAHPWTLTELARLVDATPNYLARCFRRDLGLSPLAYLARRRAEEAAALLAHTHLPAKEIGRRVGYPDANHFSRRFRAQFQKPPTDYRRVVQPGAGRGP